jgi:hypothetical protein
MDQHALVTVKDAICLMKNLQEVLPSQTSHPSIEIACSMRRPSRRPNAIQAELEAPMRPRGTEGSNPVPSTGEPSTNLTPSISVIGVSLSYPSELICARLSDRAIDVQVGRLRHKLQDGPRPPSLMLIKTVRRSGYIFTPVVEMK